MKRGDFMSIKDRMNAEYSSENKNKSNIVNVTNLNNISENEGYEQMSLPDGGSGNKEAIDNLRRATK